jgi:two-component system response regulator GlrR
VSPDDTDDDGRAAGPVDPVAATAQLPRAAPPPGRPRVTVVAGRAAGASFAPEGDRYSIGSHELNGVVLEDETVSRFHCEIRLDEHGARVVDLRSRNGTFVDGVRVNDAYVRDGGLVQLGAVQLRLEGAPAGTPDVPLSPRTRFGGLVGSSRRMRHAIALLEGAAASDVTVLLQGETGTGKGRAAEAIHAASARAAGPFLVVDCGAVPASLLESELFGHEKGAFTGAGARRIGAFEEASGGTIFLDEIGELPPELQPKLLRALENREIRRVGANRHLPVDLRVVAATNRDLREAVNDGGFRSDLYYRLAVLTIELPPLRERPEDIPEIVDELLRHLGAPPSLLGPEDLAELRRGRWPGNARELRNHLEARRVLAALAGAPAAPPGGVVPFVDARRQAIDRFEREYLEDLLRRHPRVAQAAQAAGIDRVYLYRLLSRQGMKP